MPDHALTLLSWNVGQDPAAWVAAAAHGTDVLLLQEAAKAPAPDGMRVVAPDLEGRWLTGGSRPRPWSTAVAVRDGITADPIPMAAIDAARGDQLGVSRVGSLAAATVHPAGGEPITVVSVYACWEDPLPGLASSWIYADASAHRIVSDLSALIGRQRGHRILVAGDWNILRGYGEDGSAYWRDRYDTVFTRMRALGLPFVGPVAGRRPDPRPAEMPDDSDTTPTYWPAGGSPTRQLDFVFASEELHGRIRVEALNGDAWTRDHCPLRIEIAG